MNNSALAPSESSDALQTALTLDCLISIVYVVVCEEWVRCVPCTGAQRADGAHVLRRADGELFVYRRDPVDSISSVDFEFSTRLVSLAPVVSRLA